MAKRYRVTTTADKKVRLYVGDMYYDLTPFMASSLSKGLDAAVKAVSGKCDGDTISK